MRITNLTSRSLPLSDGTILAAAGRDGSSKEVKELSDRDRKRLQGAVHVSEPGAIATGSSELPAEPAKSRAGRMPANRPQDAGAPEDK